MPEGAGEAAACPGAAENVSRTTGGCFAHRISVRYQRRGFPVPNITPVPACFLHRVPLKMRRVPQEAVLRTARIFRTPGGPLRYRMPQTQRSHILRRRLPRHQHPHYSHPTHYSHALITDIPSLQPSPHGSRLGQETTALRKNPCNFFKKLLELSRSFLYLCRINTATRNANSLRPIQPTP